MIELQNVSFSYDGQMDNGLHNVSLDIPKGQFVLLCGESGCGKTTVTRLINGLIPHFFQGEFSGSVTVCGLDVKETAIAKLSDHVGSVFQNPRTQFFNTDVNSEIVFGLENRGMPPERMERRLRQVTAELRMEDLADRSIFELSGGEKQKVAFASVYAAEPEILVLDEPSSNLDPQAIEELAALLQKAKEQGKTVVVAEHRLWYLMALADRVIYMKDGRLERDMSMNVFADLPTAEYAAMGLRCRNLGEVSPAKTAAQVQAPTLKVESLAVRLGEKEILKNLNFQMQAGEIVAIAGPNGAGKTTLVRTLCGLQKPASGSILLDGSPLKDKARKKLSYLVMQDVGHQLFSDSVESECVLGVKEPDPALVAQALEWLDLDHLRQRHPLSLSGGQKQRLAVAVSLICGKDLLAFDEPTSGLDRKSLKEVGLLLRELSQRRKLVLVITHDFELIQSACTRVLVLREGKLVADLSGEGRTKIREIWKE